MAGNQVTVYRYDSPSGETFDDDWVAKGGPNEDEDIKAFGTASAFAEHLIATANYSYDPQVAGGTGGNVGQDDAIDMQYAMSIANALYNYLPESVVKAYAQGYVKYGGDRDLALAYTRSTKEYKDNFDYLVREDGTLIMSEIEAMSNIESFKSTLAEVGITDFTEFTKQFEGMITNKTSPSEFQQRIDLVYNNVIDRIPEVKELFAQQYGIDTDDATIFASLINPNIEDKVLKGTISTINIAAEATSRGFAYSFDRFNRLKQLGMTVETARGVYETAGSLIESAKSVGRDLGISTIEEAALGDVESARRLQRITGEIESQSGIRAGARKKDDKVTGLTEI